MVQRTEEKTTLETKAQRDNSQPHWYEAEREEKNTDSLDTLHGMGCLGPTSTRCTPGNGVLTPADGPPYGK